MFKLIQRSSAVRNDPTSTLLRLLPATWRGGSDAEDRSRNEVVRQRPHRGAEQRHVDDGRLAGALALEQRGRDSAREVRAARRVTERAAGLHELTALRA